MPFGRKGEDSCKEFWRDTIDGSNGVHEARYNSESLSERGVERLKLE